MINLTEGSSVQVAVLASFLPGKAPVPHKVKLKDELGNEHSLSVDKIDYTEKALGWIKYQCQAFFDNYSTQFTLIYWKETVRWEIRRESHYLPVKEIKLPY